MAPLVIDRALLLTLAGEASVDPRSVARVLAGERVRGMAHGRVLRVLAARGIVTPGGPAALATIGDPLAVGDGRGPRL